MASTGVFTVTETGTYQLSFMGDVRIDAGYFASYSLHVNDQVRKYKSGRSIYRAQGNSWVKGSVFFVLIFALLSLFSPSPLCDAILDRKQALH